MSSLAIACLLHVALLLPVVAGGAWSWHRYSAPLLIDTIDADEMVVGAVHRWTTVTYTLLALGFSALAAPDKHDVAGGAGAAVLYSWATVVFWLGLAHAVALWAFLRRRHRREQALMPPRVWAPPPMPRPAPGYLPPPAAPVYGPAFGRPPLYGAIHPSQVYAPPAAWTTPAPSPTWGQYQPH